MGVTLGPIATIRFTRHWQHYFRGDEAVFPLHIANNLVATGYGVGLPPPAEYLQGDPPQPPQQPQRGAPPAVVRK